jgi:peptidase M1-like protein
MDWGDRGYWKVVTPHEVAHQWWGHTVGFSSGRDQWMSEGFSDMSASLYLTLIEKNPKKFLTFWNDERKLLLEKDPEGFRAIDAGPLTMGYRHQQFAHRIRYGPPVNLSQRCLCVAHGSHDDARPTEGRPIVQRNDAGFREDVFGQGGHDGKTSRP